MPEPEDGKREPPVAECSTPNTNSVREEKEKRERSERVKKER